VNSELQSLVEVQGVDLKIGELRLKADQIPSEISKLEETLEERREGLDVATAALEEENAKRRKLEGEVEDARLQLSRYRSQLMEVKTNKEYQAMLHEITNVEAQISSQEDQILEGMLAIEDAEKRVQEAKTIFVGQEKEILTKKSELEGFAAQAVREIEELQQQRAILEKEVPEGLQEQYRRIALVRNGVALAEARDHSCQACHVRLRPQLFAEVKTNHTIITCENCNRFLYFPET
jgi:predicted  nucleic acid-binding Zn-ribbon protein